MGRLTYLGSLGYTGPAGLARAGTTARSGCPSVWSALTVPDAVRAALGDSKPGPVLLIDDRIETGWTMTVAAKLLREAGAPAVLPLALAVTTG